MILATHAITGAALATLVPTRPGLAFVVGFASHFLLDAIPHWDYELRSKHENDQDYLQNDLVVGRNFYLDLIKIGFDALAGLFLAWAIFHSFFTDHGRLGIVTFLAGTAGGVLPDLLQFCYFKLRWPILTQLQRFHHWIHTNYRIKHRPVLGLTLQLLFVALVVWVVIMFDKNTI
ncbi:MAG: hypothetical protein AAB505_02605 [Patescibacteria group bacterium]